MIGWWIVITALTPEEQTKITEDERKAAMLANWETSVGGLDWIKTLIAQGKVTELARGGYPNRYMAKAEDVLTILENGIPDHKGMMIFGDDYVTPAGWKDNIVLHQERMDECKKDKIITIEAWDLS
ncbi:hypothetical protein ACO0K7_19235 [Undibacterium sp. Ji67W]|uniref:hypothetical protein n=1 Tax=Undibacterium sp. Ji67W TaxID=3413042 RepID=UPI003BEF5A8E